MSYTNGLDKPSDYFNTKLYAGNNGTQSITGIGFAPDWVWIKNRDTTDNNVLYDTVRGVQKRLISNNTDAEATKTNGLTAFGSDGFSLGSAGESNDNNLVSWNWKAGTSFTNDASGTGIGTIDSTGSVNTDAGFSIISYTGNGSAGATVAHGLGAVPKMIIFKRRGSGGWNVYHAGIGNTKSISLNTDQPTDTDIAYWNNTTPTSSVFSLGTSAAGNGNGNSMISYCFAEKQGYSKFGSYTGNGSATDGTFIYTGFKPAWLVAKRTNDTGAWYTVDNKRDTFNVTHKWLDLDSSDAENTSSAALNVDFLSNGFKNRTSNNSRNGSGQSYIYMAFAENPFTTSTGIPATAK